MPPEPLPWDRKDFFRDRNHSNGYDRVSEPLSGPLARWGENPPHGSRNEFGRWRFPPDFRRPPGHGKQGGWNPYHEDFSHGYPPSRSNDRFFQDGSGFRPSGPYRDGRYPRNFRESRASFSQRDLRGQSWDCNHQHGTASGGPPESLCDEKDKKFLDDAQTRFSHSHSDIANAPDQSHIEQQPDEPCSVNESSMGQSVEKANSLPCTEWKPLKWSRSGSLTSRNSGFGPSSSSKGAGEPCDVKVELPSKIATPDESSSGDAVGFIASPASLEDTASRKKPRLGWGEGLAKYEKKKVDSPYDCHSKSPSALCTSNSDLMHSPSLDLVDKSPRMGSFRDCRSPMTPSSAAYSPSPGLDDKSCMKVVDTDSDSNYMSPSPAPRSQIHSEGVATSLEIVQFKSPFELSELLSEVLQHEEQSLVDPGLIKNSTINKLISLKGDFLKALESTESEIDTLENELKSLNFEHGSDGPCPESSSSMSTDCKEKPLCGLSMNQRPPALTIISSSDVVGEGFPGGNVPEEARPEVVEVQGGCTESPGTATSKFTESLSSDKVPSPDHMKDVNVQNMSDLVSASCEPCTSICVQKEAGSPVSTGESGMAKHVNASGDENMAVSETLEDNTLDSIIAFNKETALKASKVFHNLLPLSSCVQESVEAISSTVSTACSQNNYLIRDKFLKIKQSVMFKERALSLKYKALHYLWKEDLQLLSERKCRTKSQKKVESNLQILHNGFLKQHRSSIRPQFASQDCCLSLSPTTEAVGSTNRLLSNPQIRRYRNDLRMPALILDKGEEVLSKFVSDNGLVKDPCAVERERPLINPWTGEEKEIFFDKLAEFGKDFKKISSFLDHKTCADCIEFYYKNHKSDFFKKAKKHRGVMKQEKSAPTTKYMVTFGKKRAEEMNAAASLDVLGAASAIVADEDIDYAKNLANCANNVKVRSSNRIQQWSDGYDVDDERETEAADVLAGICASLSSEAMSSCITSSVDHGDGNQDHKTSSEPSGIRCLPTAEVTRDADDGTCSDESCGYVDPVDWTDDEKSSFLQAYSTYGKDFVMISRCIQTKSRDQCKVFFSKARKCLGLEVMCSGPGNQTIRATDDTDGGHSDTEDACVVENEPATCSEKSSERAVENAPLPLPAASANQDCNRDPLDASDTLPDNGSVLDEKVDNLERLRDLENGDVSATSACGEDPISEGNTPENEAVNEVEDAALHFPAISKSVGLGSVHGGQDSSSAPSSCERQTNDHAKRSPTTNDLHQLLPCQTSSDLRGSLDLSIQTDTSPVLSDLQSPTHLGVSKTEAGVQPLQAYLKKCNRTVPSVHAAGKLALFSRSQSHTGEPGQSEKQGIHGGVKLFGKILSKPSTTEKPTSTPCSSLDPLSVGNEIDKQAPSSNGAFGPENFPVRSYGFWDRNRVQTGYALPDSSMLLSKFPAVFPGPSLPEQPQPPIQPMSNLSNNDNIALAEYQRVYTAEPKATRPYKLEVVQEDVFPGMPRKGYEAVSGLQQIKLSVVQSDVRAGVACSGLTDPVAALEKAWRGKNGGGVGR